MYIIPDRLELQFPRIKQGYFSIKGYSGKDNLKLLCNWICIELIQKERSWRSIREELKLDDDYFLESFFCKSTGLYPQDFARYWNKKRKEHLEK
jgi:hypothetical protein